MWGFSQVGRHRACNPASGVQIPEAPPGSGWTAGKTDLLNVYLSPSVRRLDNVPIVVTRRDDGKEFGWRLQYRRKQLITRSHRGGGWKPRALVFPSAGGDSHGGRVVGASLGCGHRKPKAPESGGYATRDETGQRRKTPGGAGDAGGSPVLFLACGADGSAPLTHRDGRRFDPGRARLLEPKTNRLSHQPFTLGNRVRGPAASL